VYAKIAVAVLALSLLAGCDKVERALSCPEGQHSEFAYFLPMVHSNPDGTVWIQQIPMYECRSN
jgi:hypothetical protein